MILPGPAQCSARFYQHRKVLLVGGCLLVFLTTVLLHGLWVTDTLVPLTRLLAATWNAAVNDLAPAHVRTILRNDLGAFTRFTTSVILVILPASLMTVVYLAIFNIVPVIYNGWRLELCSLLHRGNLCRRDDVMSWQRAFKETPLPTKSLHDTNPHAAAAADRSGAEDFFTYVAALVGGRVNDIQSSSRTTSRGVAGVRDWHFAKDTKQEPQDTCREGNAPMLIDVDYWLDMPAFLAAAPVSRPTFLYTFVPPTVASPMVNGYSWYFDEQNTLHAAVAGGGQYKHKLWNWSRDCIRATSWFWFIPTGVTFYEVTRRPSRAAHHEMVGLFPLSSWSIRGLRDISGRGFFRTLLDFPIDLIMILMAIWLVNGEALGGLDVHNEGWNVITRHSEDATTHSIAKVNDLASVEVDAVVLSELRSRHVNTPKTITSYTVKSALPKGDQDRCGILTQFIRETTPRRYTYVFPITSSILHYVFSTTGHDPSAKQSLQAIAKPLISDACYSNLNCEANERQAVQGRIIDVRSDVIEPTAFLMNAMRDFVELMVPAESRHTVHPIDYETVFTEQPRPTQQIKLHAGDSADAQASSPTSTFLKKESYAETKDPRIISTIDANIKYRYSTVQYAVSDYLKRFKWYAFGKKPAAISKRVAEMSTEAKTMQADDASRMDGHVSNVVRDLERMFLLALFSEEHHAEIISLHDSQYNVTGYTTNGIKYETLFARLSGSPETSGFNTLLTKFYHYLAWRTVKKGKHFMSSEEAFERDGLYGGDDGITPDLPDKNVVKAGRMIGQVIKPMTFHRGDAGVNFLARFYSPEVWIGRTDSCCDIRRQAIKIHTTANMPPGITNATKMQEKAISYYLTDKNTPIIGDYARRVLELENVDLTQIDPTADVLGLRRWNSKHPESVQFPNEAGEWMKAFMCKQLPTFPYDTFLADIAQAESTDDLLQMGPWSSVPIVPRANTVVDGDDNSPPGATDTPVDETSEEDKKKQTVLDKNIPVVAIRDHPGAPAAKTILVAGCVGEASQGWADAMFTAATYINAKVPSTAIVPVQWQRGIRRIAQKSVFKTHGKLVVVHATPEVLTHLRQQDEKQ